MLTCKKTILACGIVVVALAVSQGFAATLHVDPNDPTAFQSVQEAIDAARSFDTVLVHPGTYLETINFKAKAITVASTDPNDPNVVAATILDGSGQTVVTFEHGEGEYSVLLGLTVQNGAIGVRCAHDYTRPQIRKCVVTSNTQEGIVAGAASIADCTISNNGTAGISCTGGGNVRVTGSVISNNGGDGIYGSSSFEVLNCVVSANGDDGIYGAYSGLKVVRNCTIVWNNGDGVYTAITGRIAVSNSIVAYNSYGLHILSGEITSNYNNVYGNANGDYVGVAHGTQDIQQEPLFADPGYFAVDGTWRNGDYHLASKVGRWDPIAQVWVADPVDSPCLDKGDPNTPIGDEPYPHGGRINLGAYGGMTEASMSEIPDSLPAACIEYPVMDFNHDCKVDQADLDIFLEHWLECNLEPEDACWPDGLPPAPQVQP